MLNFHLIDGYLCNLLVVQVTTNQRLHNFKIPCFYRNIAVDVLLPSDDPVCHHSHNQIFGLQIL